MEWLGWIGMVVGLFALFVGWDLIFCGGRRCAQIADRKTRDSYGCGAKKTG